MQQSAKRIFRPMSGLIYQLEYQNCCEERDCDLCIFIRKYYNINFNTKPLVFHKYCEDFLKEAACFYKRFNLKYDGRDPMTCFDEERFFSEG